MATLIIKFASNGDQLHYQPVPVHVWIKGRPRCCILLAVHSEWTISCGNENYELGVPNRNDLLREL